MKETQDSKVHNKLCDPWKKGEIRGQRGANLSHMKVKAELH